MSNTTKAGFDTTNNDRNAFIGFAAFLRIDHNCAIWALTTTTWSLMLSSSAQARSGANRSHVRLKSRNARAISESPALDQAVARLGPVADLLRDAQGGVDGGVLQLDEAIGLP